MTKINDIRKTLTLLRRISKYDITSGYLTKLDLT